MLNQSLRLSPVETSTLVLLRQVTLALGDGPAADGLPVHCRQANAQAAGACFFWG
jgi:hypothetical protein